MIDTSLIPPYFFITFLFAAIGLMTLMRGYSKFKKAWKERDFPRRGRRIMGAVFVMFVAVLLFFCSYLEGIQLMDIWHPVVTLGPFAPKSQDVQ